MSRLAHRLRLRIGRRGAVLLMFSAAFLCIGLKAFTDPSVDDGRFVFYTLLPAYARAVLWGFPAIVGLLTALRGRKGDSLGFAALCVPALFVAASYLWSFVGYIAGATPYAYGWVSATTWLLISGVLLVTSGWAEVPANARRHTETVVITEPEEDE